jgi:glycosyltransferase involved in cell wall biosynthesis
MKILVVTGIFPPDIGGPATYIPEIAKALLQRGHEVTVVTTSEPEWLNFDDSQHPFQVVRMNRRVHLGLRPLYFAKTILHHTKKTDVVLANGVLLETTVASSLARKPIVQKIVGDPSWERARNRGWTTDSFEVFQETCYGLRIETLKKLRTFLTRRADKIIVPSRYLANWVGRWGIPKSRILVIYNSVQSLDSVDPVHSPLTSPVKLVTACRLVSWKCVDSIIQAVKQLEGVGLVICGDGPERNSLNQLASDLKLTDRVHFAGQTGREKALALMAACDIFVLNSTYEGLSHVVLEAMSLGLPVVVTSAGGNPELVKNGKTGIIVENGDVEALRSAIFQLVGSPHRLQRMRENAKLAAKAFSVSRMVEETEQALQAVVQKLMN